MRIPAQIPGLYGTHANSIVCAETNFSQIAGVSDGASQLRLCGRYGGLLGNSHFSDQQAEHANQRPLRWLKQLLRRLRQIGNCISQLPPSKAFAATSLICAIFVVWESLARVRPSCVRLGALAAPPVKSVNRFSDGVSFANRHVVSSASSRCDTAASSVIGISEA
jgi:hypothetical protein